MILAYQLLVSSWYCQSPQTFRISECAKYRKDIWVYGSVISTSGFGKTNGRHLFRLYLLFRFWPAYQFVSS